MRIAYPLACCLLAAPSFAQDIEIQRTESRWRVGVETLDTGPYGEAQLLGVHYDFLGLLDAYPAFYLGLGGYGQFGNDAGGVFAAGFTPGLRYPITPDWGVEGGLFLGGGAVAGPEQQRGWVARPFLAVERLYRSFGLRLELASFEFEQVERDISLSLGISLPSEWLSGSKAKLPYRVPREAMLKREVRVSTRFHNLNPTSDTQNRAGAPLRQDIELMGLGMDYFLDEDWFIPLELAGATGGEVDGFALAMLGLGYRYPLGNGRFSLEAKASAGIAQGGGVSTGGGLAWSLGAAVRARLASQLSAELGSDWITSPNGDFEASGWSLGLTWSVNPLGFVDAWPRSAFFDAGPASEDAELHPTRIGVLSKFYSPMSQSKTKSGGPLDTTISLIGVEIEEPINSFLSATGRGFVAWSGEAGGYREGSLGLRFSHHIFEIPEHVFSVGVELGAGGGGQIDVGPGLLVNTYVGFTYTLRDGDFVQAEFGRTHTDSNSFEAESFTIGYTWDLQRVLAK